MTITFTNLGASADPPDINASTDAALYTNSIWTPPTSGLIIVGVWNRAATPGTPTISGNGLTWEEIATITVVTVQKLTLFGANASGSSIGVTTIDFALATQIGCRASFFLAEGVDLSSGVAAAFVQTPTNTGDSVGSLSITLAPASHADNRPIVVFGHASNEVTTPRTDWDEMDDLPNNAPNFCVETQARDDAFETTASASWANPGVAALGIAAELKALIAAGTTRKFQRASILGV